MGTKIATKSNQFDQRIRKRLQRTDAADITGHIKNPGHKILTLSESENGPILACVLLEFFDRERGKGCYLGMLTVKPNLQSQGIGRFLLEASEEDARRWGAGFVILGVIQVRESLIAWYERRGYKKSGLTKPFPYGNLQFGAPKREDLYFVFFEKGLQP
jgi:GNAT superfamily N-acetyltransferase